MSSNKRARREPSSVERLMDECKKLKPSHFKVNKYIKDLQFERLGNNINSTFRYQFADDVIFEGTVLHIACLLGHHEIVERLLDRFTNNFGILLDVNVPFRFGIFEGTALHIACFRGHCEIIEKLLDSTNILLSPVDVNAVGTEQGNTPLIYACKANQPLAVRRLLQNSNVQLNATDKEKKTSLHHACEYGHIDVVKELLRHSDIMVTARDKDGNIPLHLACSTSRNGATSIVEMLLSHQPEHYQHTQLKEIDNRSTTALHIACNKRCCTDTLQVLLNHTSLRDINAIDADGNTPLHHIFVSLDNVTATEKIYKREKLEKLLQHPDILLNIRNFDNNTPLDIAYSKFDPTIDAERNDTSGDVKILKQMIEMLERKLFEQRYHAFNFLTEYEG